MRKHKTQTPNPMAHNIEKKTTTTTQPSPYRFQSNFVGYANFVCLLVAAYTCPFSRNKHTYAIFVEQCYKLFDYYYRHSRIRLCCSLFFYHFLFIYSLILQLLRLAMKAIACAKKKKTKQKIGRPDGQTTHISAINKHDSVVAVNLLAIFRDER